MIRVLFRDGSMRIYPADKWLARDPSHSEEVELLLVNKKAVAVVREWVSIEIVQEKEEDSAGF